MGIRGSISLLLVVATLCVYFQVRGHSFLDHGDREYFLENPMLANEFSLASIEKAIGSPSYGNWVPVTSLSILIDLALFGGHPAGTLLTNVALHALASVLLFLALARMTGCVYRSAFVAGVFALHPLHVESVAWASERKDVLSGVFWMLTLLLYARYAEGGDSLRRYQMVGFALVLGLLAKPSLVTLPFVLVLLDFWPLRRLEGAPQGPAGLPSTRQITWALREKLQLIAMSVAVSAITLSVETKSGFTSREGSLPIAVRIANAFESYVTYIRDAVFPRDLAVFYPHPMEDVIGWPAAACGGLLVAITVLVLRRGAARPYLVTGWFWYLGTLVPVIGFVQAGVQARADRYMYVPLVGLAILAAWGVPDLLARFLGEKPRRAALAVVGPATLVALGVAAHAQVSIWRDTQTLFEHALAVTEDNFIAHHALARDALAAGRLDEADGGFAEASRIAPGWSEPYFGLADVALRRKDLDVALERYGAGLAIDPTHARAHAGVGLTYVRKGWFKPAVVHLALAQELGVRSPVVLSGLGVAYDRLGRPDLAVLHNREALRLDPGYQAAANNLAWLLATTSDPALREPAEAVRIAETSVKGAGASPGLLDTLAAAYAADGRFEEAVATASRAAELAGGAGLDALAEQIRSRLALYRESRPYVDERAVMEDAEEAPMDAPADAEEAPMDAPADAEEAPIDAPADAEEAPMDAPADAESPSELPGSSSDTALDAA